MLKWDTKFWLWTKTTKEVKPARYNNWAKQNTSTAKGILGLFLYLLMYCQQQMVFSIKCEMIGWLWIGKNMEERSCGSLILWYYPRNCLDRLRKLMINLSKDIWSPGWNMNPESLIYESWTLLLCDIQFKWESRKRPNHYQSNMLCFNKGRHTDAVKQRFHLYMTNNVMIITFQNCNENSEMFQNVQSSPMFTSAKWQNI